MLYTQEQYEILDFALRRASVEITLMRYHNDDIVKKMKDGLKDIRWCIKGDTEELRRIRELCTTERRLKDRYAKMILRKIKMVRESLAIIPEPKSLKRAYGIFDRLHDRAEIALRIFLINP